MHVHHTFQSDFYVTVLARVCDGENQRGKGKAKKGNVNCKLYCQNDMMFHAMKSQIGCC